ncbi:MAG: DinB family protein [Acidobacteriota bacterium]|nr:DinB family protein [Acidobacteriota bacterium]
MRHAEETTDSGFPSAYASLPTASLLETYAAAPDRLVRALDGLTDAELRSHPVAGKWSIQEIAIHVSDSEIVGAVRFRKVLMERDPVLPGYDESVWATGLDYGKRDASFRRASLHAFRNLRETAAAILGEATGADWVREGRHPEWGPVTLRQLLELYADHGERHIEQIVERRRLLGHSPGPASLLPVRLY